MKTNHSIYVLMLSLSLSLLSSCASYQSALKSTVDYLNERQAKGCVHGHIIAGGGFGAGVTGSIIFVASTGGIDPKLCQNGEILR